MSVGKSGCLGLLSGKSMWFSGADGADFTTDHQTAFDEGMRSLAVGPDCRSAVFSIPDELLVAWVAQGEEPHAVTASFSPLLVVARPQENARRRLRLRSNVRLSACAEARSS